MLTGAVAFLPHLRDEVRSAPTSAATRLLRAAAQPLSLIAAALEEAGELEALSCVRDALGPTRIDLPAEETDRRRLLEGWCVALDRLAAILPKALPSVAAAARDAAAAETAAREQRAARRAAATARKTEKTTKATAPAPAGDRTTRPERPAPAAANAVTAKKKVATKKVATKKVAGRKKVAARKIAGKKKVATSKAAARKTTSRATPAPKAASTTPPRKIATRKTTARTTGASTGSSDVPASDPAARRTAAARRKTTARKTNARRKAAARTARPAGMAATDTSSSQRPKPPARKVGPRRSKTAGAGRGTTAARRTSTSASGKTSTRKTVSRRKTAARRDATRRRIATRTTVTRRTPGTPPTTTTASATPPATPPAPPHTAPPHTAPAPAPVTPEGSTPADAASESPMVPSLEPTDAIVPHPADDAGWSTTILTLPTHRAEQLQFAVSDLRPLAAQIQEAVSLCHDVLGRSEGSSLLQSIARDMKSARGDFRFAALDTLIDLVDVIGVAIADCSEECLYEFIVRAQAIHQLLDQFLAGVEVGLETSWPLAVLGRRIRALAEGHVPPAETSIWHRRDPDRALELDLVVEGLEAPPSWIVAEPEPAEDAAESGEAAPVTRVAEDRQARVSVSILEGLADLAGQLVLCKNRLFGLTRDEARPIDDRDLLEQLTGVAKEFEQLTTSLQADVLRTRTVPLAMLFDRYARVVRDVARINEREVELEVSGSAVEIDRDTIERLGEPLNRIVRFAARCVEDAEDRKAAGKPATAHMRLHASADEGRVTLEVTVDGELPDRAEIEQIVTTLGLVDEEDFAALDEDEVMMLLTEEDFPGSDLSGVRELLEPTRSRLRIRRTGTGLCCELQVPVRATSVRSIICRVGEHVYAVPIRNVLEIVRPDEHVLVHASRSRLLRRREGLLPLISAAELLEEGALADEWTALVVRGSDQTFGLVVDAVLGQEEVVIKSLGDGRRFGPIAGATIREDGGVSLILDIEAVEDAARNSVTGARLAA